MLCPKCGAAVTSAAAVECPLCGVVLSKASARGGRTQYARLRNTDPVAKAAKKKPISRLLLSSQSRSSIAGIVLYQQRTVAMAGPSRGWESGAEGYRRALAEQKTGGKPILLYFYTDARDFGVESVPTVYVISARSQRP